MPGQIEGDADCCQLSGQASSGPADSWAPPVTVPLADGGDPLPASESSDAWAGHLHWWLLCRTTGHHDRSLATTGGVRPL